MIPDQCSLNIVKEMFEDISYSVTADRLTIYGQQKCLRERRKCKYEIFFCENESLSSCVDFRESDRKHFQSNK